MAPDARRAAIIRAVTPLLLEHGATVTSRQLADAAGIAEGTIFRAFGDKESLIVAVLAAHRDGGELRAELDAISDDLAVDDTIGRILEVLVDRMSTIVRLAIALGRPGPPHGRGHPDHAEMVARSRELVAAIAAILERHADELTAPPEVVAHYLRMSATAAALPHLHPGMEFTVPDLSTLVREGVVRR